MGKGLGYFFLVIGLILFYLSSGNVDLNTDSSISPIVQNIFYFGLAFFIIGLMIVLFSKSKSPYR